MAVTPSRWDWWHGTDLRVALPGWRAGKLQAIWTPSHLHPAFPAGNVCHSVSFTCVRKYKSPVHMCGS